MSSEEPAVTVLVVEDELPIRRFLRALLDSHGFRVLEAGSAREGMALLTASSPDLLLLDLGLPDGDGVELTRRIREWSQLPILVLSARTDEQDKVSALDAGADDYLTKPFGANELLARIRVALRRTQRTDEGASTVVAGPLQIDLATRRVSIDGAAIHLTPIEWRLLVTLARHPGRVLTHRQLLEEVWGRNVAAQPHYVRVFMAQLRRKLEPDPARPRWLVTESGVGYRFVADG